MLREMSTELHDIRWLETLASGLETAQKIDRMVLVHPCGQGIGEAGDL